MSKSLIKCTSHNRLSRCDTPSSLTTSLTLWKITKKKKFRSFLKPKAIIESFFRHPRFSSIFCNVCLLECTRCALTHFFAQKPSLQGQQHHWENSHCRREPFVQPHQYYRWIHTRQGKVTWRVHHEEGAPMNCLCEGMIVPLRRWPSPKIITMWQFTSRQLDTEPQFFHTFQLRDEDWGVHSSSNT